MLVGFFYTRPVSEALLALPRLFLGVRRKRVSLLSRRPVCLLTSQSVLLRFVPDKMAQRIREGSAPAPTSARTNCKIVVLFIFHYLLSFGYYIIECIIYLQLPIHTHGRQTWLSIAPWLSLWFVSAISIVYVHPLLFSPLSLGLFCFVPLVRTKILPYIILASPPFCKLLFVCRLFYIIFFIFHYDHIFAYLVFFS